MRATTAKTGSEVIPAESRARAGAWVQARARRSGAGRYWMAMAAAMLNVPVMADTLSRQNVSAANGPARRVIHVPPVVVSGPIVARVVGEAKGALSSDCSCNVMVV